MYGSQTIEIPLGSCRSSRIPQNLAQRLASHVRLSTKLGLVHGAVCSQSLYELSSVRPRLIHINRSQNLLGLGSDNETHNVC